MIIETIIRFSIIIVIGLLVIGYYYFQKNKYQTPMKKNTFHKVNATIIEVVYGIKKGKNAHGKWYKIKARYQTLNMQTIESISKDTITVNKDYNPGDKIEIMYCENNPKFFYLAENNVSQNLRRILYIGLFLCILGIICMTIYWPR